MDSDKTTFKIAADSTTEKQNDFSHTYITIIIAILMLFFEAIYILLSAFKSGFLKKEILTSNSNIGFDIIIKNK